MPTHVLYCPLVITLVNLICGDELKHFYDRVVANAVVQVSLILTTALGALYWAKASACTSGQVYFMKALMLLH